MTKVRLTVSARGEDAGAGGRLAEPTTLGVPLPRGLLRDPSAVRLLDAASHDIPVQSRVLDRWADGSIRWLLVDFQATVAPGSAGCEYELEVGSRPRLPFDNVLSAAAGGDGVIVVSTGAAQFYLQPGGAFPFQRAVVNGADAIDAARSHLSVEDRHGVPQPVHVSHVALEDAGPLRATVHVTGTIGDRRRPLLDLACRLHFFRGSPAVRFELLVRNGRRAAHPGGIWELGDAGSVFVRHMSLTLAVAGEPRGVIRCSPEGGWPESRYRPPFSLYQDSSGGPAWQSAVHVNGRGRIPIAFRGYRITSDQGCVTADGIRATPIVTVQTASAGVSAAMPCFWQQFPKAMDASGDALMLGLFPRQFGDLHEIQGGEQKTHTFVIAFGADPVCDAQLEWVRAPLFARTDPAWNCSTGAVRYMVPAADDPDSSHARLVASAIDGPDSFERKRELIDEYGWRNFGDLYADHEAAFAPAGSPLVSHYNNQYDAVAGFACQFLRSGDDRWWAAMDQLASHVVDIDVYHTDRDKAAYNGGLFWHTCHYTDAGASTHRSYPRRTGGGGPSAEHNYTTGLMLHYFLTGNPASRDTAIDLARWVMRMDDGRLTVFNWLDGRDTGLATATGSPLYHGPGRGGANSINALLDAHRLTGDGALLAKAEQLIRRSIHPADDIARLNLLDAERRWFYTVFLCTLGKYLDDKAERGEFDGMFAYGRASLLHYARWMAEYESPYLDRPDTLEYPTETWAAQDMRKSDVFNLASRHAEGDERRRFLDRAEYFFRYATTALGSMPTHGRTRPTVLLLTLGLIHAYVQRTTGEPPPALGPVDFGVPQRFVPQKTWVERQLLVAGGTTAALLLLAGAYLFS